MRRSGTFWSARTIRTGSLSSSNLLLRGICEKTCMEEDIKVVLEVIKWLLTEGLKDDSAAPAPADNRPKCQKTTS